MPLHRAYLAQYKELLFFFESVAFLDPRERTSPFKDLESCKVLFNDKARQMLQSSGHWAVSWRLDITPTADFNALS